MAIKKYTIAEFRKATREAFNEVEQGGKVFISRHNTRYELVRADVQSGKKQFEETPIVTPKKATAFPNNGDSGAQIATADDIASAFDAPLPEKNIADADASKGKVTTNADILEEWESKGTAAPDNTLHIARGLMRNQLNGIDIETQDPEQVELGATLAASIDEITKELKKRGAE